MPSRYPGRFCAVRRDRNGEKNEPDEMQCNRRPRKRMRRLPTSSERTISPPPWCALTTSTSSPEASLTTWWPLARSGALCPRSRWPGEPVRPSCRLMAQRLPTSDCRSDCAPFAAGARRAISRASTTPSVPTAMILSPARVRAAAIGDASWVRSRSIPSRV